MTCHRINTWTAYLRSAFLHGSAIYCYKNMICHTVDTWMISSWCELSCVHSVGQLTRSSCHTTYTYVVSPLCGLWCVPSVYHSWKMLFHIESSWMVCLQYGCWHDVAVCRFWRTFFHICCSCMVSLRYAFSRVDSNDICAKSLFHRTHSYGAFHSFSSSFDFQCPYYNPPQFLTDRNSAHLYWQTCWPLNWLHNLTLYWSNDLIWNEPETLCWSILSYANNCLEDVGSGMKSLVFYVFS